MEAREAGVRADPSPGLACARRCGALWLLALLFGSYLRVVGVAGQPIEGDEHVAIATIERGYHAVLTTFDGRGSHIGYSLLQRLALDLCGENVLAYRLPSLLAGVLALVLVYPLGIPLVGRGPAALAAAALAVHPMHVYYSRFGRPYALAVLLMLLLVAALERALRGRRGAWAWVLVLACLAPWVHLSTAGGVVLLALVALGWRWKTGGFPRLPLAIFAGAALACLLLYLPAWSGVHAYLGRVAGIVRRTEIEPLGVLRFAGGTLPYAIALIALGTAGALVLSRRTARVGLLFLAALVAPSLTLLVTQPGGSEWAYARYLLPALAPLLWAAAWSAFQLVASFASGTAALALGCGLLALQAWRGPLQVRDLDRTFANNPWVMLVLRPEADAPYEPVPEIYRRLGASPRPLTVVEYPVGSAMLLFRHYERIHRQRVLVGVGHPENGLQRSHPYVSLRALEAEPGGVDWVIVHHDLDAEVRSYHRFLGLKGGEPSGPLVDRLADFDAEWGPPDHRDALVSAWNRSKR